MEAVRKDFFGGVVCYRCRRCDKILIRVEKRSPLGGELNFLDIMVIRDHWISEHGETLKTTKG